MGLTCEFYYFATVLQKSKSAQRSRVIHLDFGSKIIISSNISEDQKDKFQTKILYLMKMTLKL